MAPAGSLGLEAGKIALGALTSRWRRRADTSPQVGPKESTGMIPPQEEAVGPRKAKGDQALCMVPRRADCPDGPESQMWAFLRYRKTKIGLQRSE